MRAAAPSLVLAALALVLSAAFLVGTYRCGAMSSEASGDAPPAPAVCVSRVHPLSVGLVLGSLASIAALLLGKPEVALVVGLVALPLGLLFVFSAGLWALPVAVSLAGAGALQMRRARRAPAPS